MVRNVLQLFEALTYLYCFAATYGQKMKYNIHAVIFIVAQLVLMTGLNDYGFPRYLVSISYALMLVYCLFNYKRTLLLALVNVGLSVVTVGVMQLLFYFTISTITKNNNIGNLLWEFLTMTFCLICAYLGADKIHLYDLSNFLIKKKILLGVIGCFILCIFSNELWKIKQNNSIGGKDVIYIIYFSILLVVLLYEWQRTRNEAEKTKIQLDMNKLYYDAYEDLIQSVREKQHDVKNHMNALRGMLYTIEDRDELVRQEGIYLDTMLQDTNTTSILTMIENPLLAGFISEKIRSAEKMGIAIKHDCRLEKKIFRVPEYKLVEAFGIIIDNAIEETIEYAGQRMKNIQLVQENDNIKFTVSNTCRKDSLGKLYLFFDREYSSKGKNRGVGLTKLQRIIQDNKGQIILNEKSVENEDMIQVTIIVPV